MNRRSFLATTSVSLVSTAFPQIASAQTQPLNLRVASTANDTYASAYFAQDLGLFTKAGLNVDLQTLNNGAAIAAAVVGGTIGIGVSTPIQIANAYLGGVPLVLVAAGALSTAKVKSLLLCVAKSSGIKSAKDLDGKIVAVNALKSGSEVGLDAWLVQNGMDISKVKVIETNFSQMAPSLLRGAIGGAVLAEPALTLALKDPGIVVLGDPNAAIAPQFVSSCWFSTREFAQQNPEILSRFSRAIYEAQKWANGHQSDSAAILAKYAKMDVALVRSVGRATFAEQMRLAEVQPFLDAAVKYGTIPKPVNAADFLIRT
jgi:NitT/TauT family transport system substrate-binding protein